MPYLLVTENCSWNFELGNLGKSRAGINKRTAYIYLMQEIALWLNLLMPRGISYFRSNLNFFWLGVVTEFSFTSGAAINRFITESSHGVKKSPNSCSGIGTLSAVLESMKFLLVASLRYSRAKRKTLHLDNSDKTKDVLNLMVVDYTAHTLKQSKSDSCFCSGYWGPLSDALDGGSKSTTYLHIHYPAAEFKNLVETRLRLGKWNFNSQNCLHLLLQDFFTWRVSWQTFCDYSRIFFFVLFSNFALASRSDFRPFFRRIQSNWHTSLVGAGALQTLFLANLFEKALSSVPYQSIGLYLQEGQPWEFAFIAAWRRVGHGKLIGVPHSTVRYWDLRYARDSRVYRRDGPDAMPRPDFVAVNGPAAKRQFLSDGYPENELVEVEALRYLHLLEQDEKGVLQGMSQPARMLLLGEYELESTIRLMDAIKHGKTTGLFDIEVRIRPHPAAPKNPDFQKFGVEISEASSLKEDVRAADVVVAMTTTSAVLDAYCLGIPVIVLEDPNCLNGSPLLGREDVPFVRTPEELAAAIDAILADPPPRVFRGHQFFYLDEGLPRWGALLGLP